jgi:glycerate 2-kinase
VPTPPVRDVLIQLFDAAITGAATGPVTARGVESLSIPRGRRVWVLSVGKAAHAMAAAATGALQRSRHEIAGGLIVAPDAAPAPYGTIQTAVGDHPVPGTNSFAAAARLGEMAGRMSSEDIAIVLVSGGASSLIAAPIKGIAEKDITKLFEMLLASGLDIAQMNAVRKRFSRWGGGRLALAIAPAGTHCLAVSDVIGDDLAIIGSGPCVPDPLYAFEVVEILKQAGLYQRLSAASRAYLTEAVDGRSPETPKDKHPAFAHVTARVIANNRGALEAAAERARALGATAVYVIDAPLLGEAARRGEELAKWLLELRASGNGARAPRFVIWGGETTVTLHAQSSGSKRKATTPAPAPPGGRCQELALAAARVLDEAGERARGISLLAAGTDGRDGPTDAAGACVSGTTWRAIRAAGCDPADALATHQSYSALQAIDALFKPGPTGTNVMDIVIGVVDSE